MLIGIDASRANRDHKTGTEWYSYYLIRWLAKLDKENQYILYTDKPLRGGLLDLTTKQYLGRENYIEEIKYDNKGFQVIKSPFNNFKGKVLNWRFPYFWTQLRMSWEMLVKRPKILFVPAHTLPFIHPKKSVVTIHDIGFERERLLYSKDKMGPDSRIGNKIINFLVRIFTFNKYGANALDYYSWSTKFALKHAKKIITVSNFSKKELVEIYQAEEKKIKVIYNGYNKFLYKKINDQEAINKVLYKYNINDPYIFYIGRLERKKNTPALIEAYAIMREENKDIQQKLVLVGDASHGYDEVSYMIREFNLDNEVIITGWMPEEDIPYIYNGATAFIFPSLYEGFGIPILQAMACGIPTTASCATAISEVVKDAAIFFNPTDVRSMANAITKVIKDHNLREKLIKRGYQRVNDFSWEKSAERTLKELNNM